MAEWVQLRILLLGLLHDSSDEVHVGLKRGQICREKRGYPFLYETSNPYDRFEAGSLGLSRSELYKAS